MRVRGHNRADRGCCGLPQRGCQPIRFAAFPGEIKQAFGLRGAGKGDRVDPAGHDLVDQPGERVVGCGGGVGVRGNRSGKAPAAARKSVRRLGASG